MQISKGLLCLFKLQGTNTNDITYVKYNTVIIMIVDIKKIYTALYVQNSGSCLCNISREF